MTTETTRRANRLIPALIGAVVTLVVVIGAGLVGGLDFSSADTIVNNPESDARGLARAVAALDATPTISDDELETIVTSLRARAADGDVPAARFVVELARLQHRTNEASTDSDAAATPDGAGN